MYVHMVARSVGSLGADVIDSSELCDVEKQFCTLNSQAFSSVHTSSIIKTQQRITPHTKQIEKQ